MGNELAPNGDMMRRTMIRGRGRGWGCGRSVRGVAAMASVALACVGTPSRGYPLYPSDGARRDITEVAQLGGYVRFVDGQDVGAHGKLFEVPPGCHVIATPSRWMGVSPTGTGAVTATTGKVTFALPMKAGHQYSVELLVRPITGPTTTIEIKAFERDGRGTMTRTFSYAKSRADLVSCHKEADDG
jgi:hypothetical protein